MSWFGCPISEAPPQTVGGLLAAAAGHERQGSRCAAVLGGGAAT